MYMSATTVSPTGLASRVEKYVCLRVQYKLMIIRHDCFYVLSLCLCVCVCVRACVRACVHACVSYDVPFFI